MLINHGAIGADDHVEEGGSGRRIAAFGILGVGAVLHELVHDAGRQFDALRLGGVVGGGLAVEFAPGGAPARPKDNRKHQHASQPHH
jgi:hypothetical protein